MKEQQQDQELQQIRFIRARQKTSIHDFNQIPIASANDDATQIAKPSEAEEDSLLMQTNRICKQCGYAGQMNQQMRMGCISWTWVVTLFLFTIILFFVPLLCNQCKNRVLYCPKCSHVIDVELARCL